VKEKEIIGVVECIDNTHRNKHCMMMRQVKLDRRDV